MARVKQAVKKQHAEKTRSCPDDPSAVMSPSTGASPASAASKPRRQSADVFSSGCIDLTLDDDTEDEEERDEPLGPSASSPRESLVDLAASGDEERDSEKTRGRAEVIEHALVDERSRGTQILGEDQDTESDTEEKPTPASKPAPVVHRFSMSDVESDEDDELPVRSVLQDVRSVEDEETKGDDEVEIIEVVKPAEASGIRSMMKKAINFMLPAYAMPREAEKAREDPGPCAEDEEEVEEEEDEALPDVYAPPTENEGASAESLASDSGSAMEIDEDGEEPVRSEVDHQPQVRVAVAGASLEDGEIFEEGAVIKSPTAVKQAIELELQAAKGAKKRPKKRGRKKNKRKAEVLLPVGTLDEFGRVVRQQTEPLTDIQPAGEELSHTPQPRPGAGPEGSTSSSSPNGSASPAPALLHTLPHPFMMPPPLPRVPPPPPHNFPNHRGRVPPFADEHIVRVNRHGSIEPFNIHHGIRPPLPQFPPMPLRPPPPVNGGFRYVSVNPFQPPPAPGANRGFKRPLPQSIFEDEGEADTGIDLDSLRAAALRTKRKLPVKESVETVVEEKSPAAPPNQSPISEQGEENDKQEEDDTSLDALRAQLLKSIRPRKRSQTTAEASKSPPQVTGGSEENQSAAASKPPTPPSRQESAVASLSVSESATPLPESPMFRPLTAASQSIVIRFSLEDLQSKERSYSVESESAISKYSRTVDDSRARADLEPKPKGDVAALMQSSSIDESQLSRENGSGSMTDSPRKSSPQLQVEKNADSMERSDDHKKKVAAADTAGQLKAFPVDAVSSPVDVQSVAASVAVAMPLENDLNDRASLEAEREACLASIREADAQLSRLDAEIAALRRVLIAKEEAATAAAPAARMAVEI